MSDTTDTNSQPEDNSKAALNEASTLTTKQIDPIDVTTDLVNVTTELVNIQSTGFVQISANGTTTVEGGQTVTISTPGYKQALKNAPAGTDTSKFGKIMMMNTGEIDLIADNNIKLVVGNSVIMITKDKIMLNCGGLFYTAGPIGSTMILSPYDGINIMSTRTKVSGTLGVNIGDGAGNKLNLGASGVTLAGSTINLNENVRKAAITSLSINGILLLTQLATTITKGIYSAEAAKQMAAAMQAMQTGDIQSAKAAQAAYQSLNKKGQLANNIQTQTQQLAALAGGCLQFVGAYGAYSKLGGAVGTGMKRSMKASAWLDLFSSILSVAVSSAGIWAGSWVDEPLDDDTTVTNGDMLHICSLACSFAAWLCLLIPQLKAMLTVNPQAAPKMRLASNSLAIQANAIKFAADNFSVDNMPSASPKDKDVSKKEVKAGDKSQDVLLEVAEKRLRDNKDKDRDDGDDGYEADDED